MEIKEEIIDFLKSKNLNEDDYSRSLKELDFFSSIEDTSSKPVINKIHNYWKNNKKGHKNPFNSSLIYNLGIVDRKPDGEFNFGKRRTFARPSPPDIDTDFDFERRHEVIDYLIWIYGREKVANVGTYGSLKMKSALTRIIKALDIANSFSKGSQAYITDNNDKAKEIKDSLPEQRGALLKIKDENGEEHVIKTTEDAVKWCPDFKYYMDKYPEILDHTRNIENLISDPGVHASGIILGDIPLSEIAPLRTAKKQDKNDTVSYSTQYTNEELEFLGLVKFDILAISTLTVISRTLGMIKDNYGIDIDIYNLPLDDKKTLDLYKSGKLKGVFQCESAGMQKTCMDVGVDRFDDIVAIISLFRPGPMESIPDYIARKKGQKNIDYIHPSIEPYVKPILANTYGIICYQEDVMLICQSLAGMTPTEALIVIKGIGKKKEDIVNKGRKSFIKGSVSNGVPQDIAEYYWDKFITPFANYGFNKSHSMAYSLLSWATAYLKANFTEEFMCSYLNVETERRKIDRVMSFESECKKLNIKVLSRDINNCELQYKIVKKKDDKLGIAESEIRPSIICKGLSLSAAENIVKNRPYKDLREFAEKTDFGLVNLEDVEMLADAKFFKTNKEKLLAEFSAIREDAKKRKLKGDFGDSLY